MEEVKPIISFDEFQKTDFAVGKVLDIVDVPVSEKLYRMTVDFGEGIGVRTIFAGLKKFFTKGKLKNKKFVFVVNLTPRPMPSYVKTSDGQARQEESQGMMLVIEEGEEILLFPAPKAAKEGARLG